VIGEPVPIVVAAPELERWMAAAARTLIKIDVEGFEPELLMALRPLLERRRPDLLIEVLPFKVDKLSSDPIVTGYEKNLILPGGLEKTDTFYASHQHRDWLLSWSASAGTTTAAS